MNKRGVSEIVVTVLMILLVIAVVTIIWAVIRPFISNSLKDVEGTADCLQLNFEITSATVAGETLSVAVRRISGDGSIAAENMRFWVKSGEEDTLVTLTGAIPGLAETQTFTGSSGAIAGDTVRVAAILAGQTCGESLPATIE